MSEALAGRIANVAPPSRLKDLYGNSRGRGRSTASWSIVAPSFATMSMPSTLADEELLNIVRSYSSRYPSLQWAEEFASISRQWKRVIDTHRHLLPRLFVDAVKVRGCQLEIRLLANDSQSSYAGPDQPTVLNNQTEDTASMLCRLAARSLIISLDEDETLEEVLIHVRRGGLNAMSVTPKSAGRLADANVKRIMGAIGEAETLRADVTCTRDIEALLPYFPPHVGSFEMVLSPSCALNDDASLDLLLYFANRMDFDDFVIKRYGSDVLELVTRTAKKFSCGFAGVLDVLVVPTYMPPLTQNAETTIAVNIRRPDGRRFLAVGEGRGMRMIIGDDRAVNERMSGRKDYNALRPLMNRGSTEFDQLRQAVYETLVSRAVGIAHFASCSTT